MVPSEFLEIFRNNGMKCQTATRGIKRLLAIDGKTQRGNGSKNQKANHIVSTVDEKGFCLGQKRADYVLALKANQGNLLEYVRLYFSEEEFLKKCAYKKTVEKARGKTEKREYWQTDDISWLSQKKDWAGLKTLLLTRNTVIGKEGETSIEERYFISSLPVGMEEAVRAVRGHWMVESFYLHLDMTFREDGNHTIEKQAAYNLNIMRKLSLNLLTLIEVGGKSLSLKKKRYAIGTNLEKHRTHIIQTVATKLLQQFFVPKNQKRVHICPTENALTQSNFT